MDVKGPIWYHLNQQILSFNVIYSLTFTYYFGGPFASSLLGPQRLNKKGTV